MSGTAQKEERGNALLEYCKEPRDREEMMKFLGIKHRTTFRSDYLNPLLDESNYAIFDIVFAIRVEF